MGHNTELINTLIQYGLVEGLCEIFSKSTDEDTLVCILSFFYSFDQLISTLLGCVITEHIGFIQSGITTCSELFIRRIQQMIIV